MPTVKIPLYLSGSHIITVILPGGHHERVDSSGAARGWRMAHLAVQIVYHLLVGQLFIWLPPHGPYLVEDHPETPHVTGRGVLSIEECLGGHPFDRERSVLCGFVVAVVHQVSGHPEIPNLQSHITNRYNFHNRGSIIVRIQTLMHDYIYLAY